MLIALVQCDRRAKYLRLCVDAVPEGRTKAECEYCCQMCVEARLSPLRFLSLIEPQDVSTSAAPSPWPFPENVRRLPVTAVQLTDMVRYWPSKFHRVPGALGVF